MAQTLRGEIGRLYLRLPESLRTEIDVRRRVPVWRRRGVVLVHVPKAAGTSLSLALYGRALGHFAARDIARIAPRLWAECFTLGVLREPVARLCSAYRFAVTGGTGLMRIARPERYAIPDFADFERFATRWLPAQDLARVDPVFRPQHHFVCDPEGRVLVDALLCMERLAADLARHGRRLGPMPALGFVNVSGGEEIAVTPAARAAIERLYARDCELHARL